MSRSEDFHGERQHPNLNSYNIEVGNTGKIESGVGYVPVERLSRMPGNSTTPGGVEHHREAIRSGQGFTDPLMVIFDPSSRRAYVGEGNHRLAAAQAEGLSHVPTRVIRGHISDDMALHIRKQGGRAGIVQTPDSPWTNGQGGQYWPPQIHPKHIWGKEVQ